MVFEDSSHLVLKREAIYSLDEDMPKRVKGRLVSIVSFSNKYVTIYKDSVKCVNTFYSHNKCVAYNKDFIVAAKFDDHCQSVS